MEKSSTDTRRHKVRGSKVWAVISTRNPKSMLGKSAQEEKLLSMIYEA